MRWPGSEPFPGCGAGRDRSRGRTESCPDAPPVGQRRPGKAPSIAVIQSSSSGGATAPGQFMCNGKDSPCPASSSATPGSTRRRLRMLTRINRGVYVLADAEVTVPHDHAVVAKPRQGATGRFPARACPICPRTASLPTQCLASQGALRPQGRHAPSRMAAEPVQDNPRSRPALPRGQRDGTPL